MFDRSQIPLILLQFWLQNININERKINLFFNEIRISLYIKYCNVLDFCKLRLPSQHRTQQNIITSTSKHKHNRSSAQCTFKRNASVSGHKYRNVSLPSTEPLRMLKSFFWARHSTFNFRTSIPLAILLSAVIPHTFISILQILCQPRSGDLRSSKNSDNHNSFHLLV